MAAAFEVKESDLMGRVGVLTVGGHRLETPLLFPVVHPVSQAVGLDELKGLGFGGVMTNSYILYKRRREEALARGVKGLLGFDGAIMTDSGGYQALEYGDVGVTREEIAAFQSGIGSDLAVTLDRPTGYSLSKRYAKGTMEYSLKNAVATLAGFGGSETTWVGPVQGGLFPDLLRRSARSMLQAGFTILALGSPVQLMQNYMYAELVRMIVAVRKAIPYAVPLHLFGAGHPHTMAISVALGCDTFDSASYILFAREGRYMTERGVSRLEEMKFLPCSCRVCVRTSVGELMSRDAPERTRLVALHNLNVLRKEVESCKEAISEGRLWDLVEERAAAHPRVYRAFLELAKESRLLEGGTPALKEKGLLLRGRADEARPELALAKSNLSGAFPKPSTRALLLRSSEPVRVTKLRLGRERRPAPDADMYRAHPSLGPYPAELDFVYPFTQTVWPDDGKDEASRDAVRRLRERGYSSVAVADVDGAGRVVVSGLRSRRRKTAASPSARSSSSRPRSPRRP